VSSVKLRNIEDNTEIVLHSNSGSPLFNQKDEAKIVGTTRKALLGHRQSPQNKYKMVASWLL